MKSVFVCLLVSVSGAFGLLAGGGPVASPWTDVSLCSSNDSLMSCQLKKGQCSPVGSVFSPAGGPVLAITTCANASGVVLGPQFFLSIGLAFVTGNPESLADMTSTNPATVTAIRRCALNSTGLLSADLTLNRTAVNASVTAAFSNPILASAVESAVATCPEPVDYSIHDFVTCLRSACMNNVTVPPFVQVAHPPVAPTPPMGPVMGSAMGGSPFLRAPMGDPGMGASPFSWSSAYAKSPFPMGSYPMMMNTVPQVGPPAVA